jgi:hypothetical protein
MAGGLFSRLPRRTNVPRIPTFIVPKDRIVFSSEWKIILRSFARIWFPREFINARIFDFLALSCAGRDPKKYGGSKTQHRKCEPRAKSTQYDT